MAQMPSSTRKLAVLKYLFLFDPTDTWQHGYQFESTFANYLESIGLKAELINPAGNAGDRAIWISAAEKLPVQKNQKQVSPKQSMDNLKKKVGG